MSRLNESQPKAEKSWSSYLRFAVFVILCFGLLLAYAAKWSQMKKLDQQLETLQAKIDALALERSELAEQEAAVDQARSDADLHNRHLKTIARYCAEPSDFWQTDSDLGICIVQQSQQMNGVVRLLVPEGEHQFSFLMERHLDKAESPDLTVKEEFTLLGPAAYEITLDLPRDEDGKHGDSRVLSLLISSSDPQFTPVRKVLLPDPIPVPTSSSSSHFEGPSPAFFPNQLTLNPIDEKPGFVLNKITWSSSPKAQPRFDLKFEMRLKSEGPRVIPAPDRWSYVYWPDKKEIKYIGKGRFEVLP
ncbi:hypothetical protein LOC67_15365 [Stieleria sp. JC731]|uniref:hypothetical protein n=1 Tax=Pirellulaceae TaxID=2691357 RepID=UPI001E579FD3|nr:hypothetical protein [Stieleria sp. JC731]MCC9601939.1 hypothetical protein [Stieleria sp. JC731]